MKNLRALFTLTALCLTVAAASTGHAKSQVTVVKAKIEDRGANGCFPAGFCRGDNLGIIESAVEKIGGPAAARQLGISKSLIGHTYSVPVLIDDSVCAQLNNVSEGEQIVLPLTPEISKALVKAGGLRAGSSGLDLVADSEQPKGFIALETYLLKNAGSLCN